jgi:hypothetical protein
MQSPVYWHPKLYSYTMRRLYGKNFENRYSSLVKLIPGNCQLLELCMGDMYFYENYLRKKNISYSCADVNPIFVNAARKKKVNSILLDILTDEIPKSDYILIQGSLYHAIPNHKELIKKLFAAAGKQLIISECVNNVSNSSNGLVSWLGALASKAKTGQSKIKFTNETLKQSFRDYERNIVQWIESPDNLEVIIVLQK